MVAKEFREKRAEAGRRRRVAASARFRRVMLDALAWIESGDWTLNDKKLIRERPAASGAAAELQRRARKIRKQGKHLAGLEHGADTSCASRQKSFAMVVNFLPARFPARSARVAGLDLPTS